MLPGGYEWILIILAILLLFGAKKVPELMHGLGKGIKEFKRGQREEGAELTDASSQKDEKKGDSPTEGGS